MKLNFLTVVKIALHSDTRTTTRTPMALLVVPKLHWKMPDSVNYAIAMSVTNLPQNVPVGILVKRVRFMRMGMVVHPKTRSSPPPKQTTQKRILVYNSTTITAMLVTRGQQRTYGKI